MGESMTAPTERVFHEIDMVGRVWDYAESHGLKQSLWALNFAAEKHEGQTRKGPEGVPYISHPLCMACQAISLGIAEDDLLAAILLHDVCEDCGVSPEELQVSEQVQTAVRLVTRTGSKADEAAELAYYEAISRSRLASMVKLLDRCHNVAFLALGMKGEKLQRYVKETESHFYPLLETAAHSWPEYEAVCWQLKYQIGSQLQTIKALI